MYALHSRRRRLCSRRPPVRKTEPVQYGSGLAGQAMVSGRAIGADEHGRAFVDCSAQRLVGRVTGAETLPTHGAGSSLQLPRRREQRYERVGSAWATGVRHVFRDIHSSWSRGPRRSLHMPNPAALHARSPIQSSLVCTAPTHAPPARIASGSPVRTRQVIHSPTGFASTPAPLRLLLALLQACPLLSHNRF